MKKTFLDWTPEYSLNLIIIYQRKYSIFLTIYIYFSNQTICFKLIRAWKKSFYQLLKTQLYSHAIFEMAKNITNTTLFKYFKIHLISSLRYHKACIFRVFKKTYHIQKKINLELKQFHYDLLYFFFLYFKIQFGLEIEEENPSLL